MASVLSRSKSIVAWVLIVPTVAWFYIGLFLTMIFWYPTGLSAGAWQAHLLNFSVVYILWLGVFLSYRLFDLNTLRTTQSFFGRLIAVMVICLVIAVLYFYFQPALLITPRRFLLVHLIISSIGIVIWYFITRRLINRFSKRPIYFHSTLTAFDEMQNLVTSHEFLGLQFAGPISVTRSIEQLIPSDSIVVIPARAEINEQEAKELFELRNAGVRFIEYHELYENLTRTVHLSALTELWFIHSVDYGAHRLFDFVKRIIDIFFGFIGATILIVTFPLIALFVSVTSRGSIFFVQPRVGQNNKIFRLFKYRTMTTDSDNNTWSNSNQKVTWIGKILRATRLDELPQSINILKGDMSIVGPRPEQVGIVENLRTEIPYYDERHIVKPGLTGWAQLHVYAASVEETKRKLQYDLYYIKHRSLIFDAEIILKTIYNILTFSGQ